jgi:hypothetical protein
MMGFIWFWLVAVMIVGYVVLDGFDLGVGVLHLILVRTEAERRATLDSIGPVWDGNEVWLLAGGGTLYFAFPLLYASAFSGFYLPLMIVLWLLILRGVSLELRNHVEVGVWRSLLDGVFGLSSGLLTIFFGAALANVLRGVPLQADGYFFLPLWTNWQPGVHPGILDWYTVIGGLVALVALTMHGALWLSIKTSSELRRRARRIVTPLCLLLAPSQPGQLLQPSVYLCCARRRGGVAGRRLVPESQVAPRDGVPLFVPLPVLHAGRGLLGALSHAAAGDDGLGPRHHPDPRSLRSARPGCGVGLVDLRHGAGHRIRRVCLQQVPRQGRPGAGPALRGPIV